MEEEWRISQNVLRNCSIQELMETFGVVMTDTNFEFANSVYHQKYGIPMGSLVMVALADLYMDHLEDKQKRLEAQWITLADEAAMAEYVLPLEQRCITIFCLNMLAKRTPSLESDISVYRKPIHSDRYLYPVSHVHPGLLENVVKYMRLQTQETCTITSGPDAEIQHP
ncbi:unnamed protein product [Soboliphyme baturini]|uniref:Cyclin_C domain-containing protein n=1 Tax=Soboliphyme baturini TaxID=241478 RepID=A0A183IJQ3_9BILA|nr:unnamed protein product [Soboliphyme baturini]